jgi:hypothetical protein
MIHQHVFDVVGMIEEENSEIQNAQPDEIAVLAGNIRKKFERVLIAAGD